MSILRPREPCSSPQPSAAPQIAGLILAGGQSSRMGTDKALVSWQGTPLLQRVCEAACRCCAMVFILTPWPERYQEILPSQCQPLLEILPGQGPLLALQQGLQKISAPWVLLLACDLPHLQPALLGQWISQLSQLSPQTLAYVPYHAGRWQPFCGFYRQQSHESLSVYIDQGGRSFQGWLSQSSIEGFFPDADSAPMLFNCNTPQDLQIQED
ncbi:MAG: molybdenum cofactor guanylyltransferase [Acaryochloridaceae cyanobacterium SU_2_1]|nr:molybdenum cofactor guanylyltransferase [Acaryochloridaceae cyanobacterium SU_2_1]